jgi:hypothetical protein
MAKFVRNQVETSLFVESGRIWGGAAEVGRISSKGHRRGLKLTSYQTLTGL